jgi:hypothetical protein
MLLVPVKMRSAVSAAQHSPDQRDEPRRPGQCRGLPDLVREQPPGSPPEHLVEQLLPVARSPVQGGPGHAEAPGQGPHVQPLSGDEDVHGRREDLGRHPVRDRGSLREHGAGVGVTVLRRGRVSSHQLAAR